MMEAESASERSVNKGTIGGAVMRTIRNAKKPISASVTAPMAARRAAPSDFTKFRKACTGLAPTRGQRVARHPARFAQCMVSVRLTGRAPDLRTYPDHAAKLPIEGREIVEAAIISNGRDRLCREPQRKCGPM